MKESDSESTCLISLYVSALDYCAIAMTQSATGIFSLVRAFFFRRVIELRRGKLSAETHKKFVSRPFLVVLMAMMASCRQFCDAYSRAININEEKSESSRLIKFVSNF